MVELVVAPDVNVVPPKYAPSTKGALPVGVATKLTPFTLSRITVCGERIPFPKAVVLLLVVTRAVVVVPFEMSNSREDPWAPVAMVPRASVVLVVPFGPMITRLSPPALRVRFPKVCEVVPLPAPRITNVPPAKVSAAPLCKMFVAAPPL